MGKVNYNGLTFDSELEVEYYKHLVELEEKGEILDFTYHPDTIPNLVGKRSYTPDFLVAYKDRIEIVETKGYSPYSKLMDDQIHNVMLSKSENFLQAYVHGVIANHIIRFCSDHWIIKKVEYHKVKYLKAFGWVEWDFKNPNTIANKRKEKITELSVELKELRQFKKDTERYFKLHNKSKLTIQQKEFIAKYLNNFYRDEE